MNALEKRLEYALNLLEEKEKENEQLKSALEDAYGYKKKYYEVKHYKMLTEKCRKALRKCSPITIDYIKDSSGEIFDAEICLFCNGWLEHGRHSDNCEYIMLTKGGEGEE